MLRLLQGPVLKQKESLENVVAFGWVGWLKCCFTSTETVGLLGTGAQDVHLDFHTPPELWAFGIRNAHFIAISFGWSGASLKQADSLGDEYRKGRPAAAVVYLKAVLLHTQKAGEKTSCVIEEKNDRNTREWIGSNLFNFTWTRGRKSAMQNWCRTLWEACRTTCEVKTHQILYFLGCWFFFSIQPGRQWEVHRNWTKLWSFIKTDLTWW